MSLLPFAAGRIAAAAAGTLAAFPAVAAALSSLRPAGGTRTAATAFSAAPVVASAAASAPAFFFARTSAARIALRPDDFRRLFAGALERFLHADDLEVDCGLFRLHGHDTDRQLVADPKLLGRMFPDHDHLAVIEPVIVVRHIADVDKALDRVFKLHKQTEVRDGRNDPFELFSDLVDHELGLLQGFGIPLRVDGPAFHFGRVLGDFRNFPVPFRLGRRRSIPFDQVGPDQPVDDQIRIPPDRRSEVGVEIRRQPEVAEAVF